MTARISPLVGRSINLIPRIVLVGATAFAGTALTAQAAVTVNSVQNGVPDLGNVVSASSGDTVFRVAASNGIVTKISGTGTRLSGGTTRALVTLRCTGGGINACPNSVTTVTVTGGATTGRARRLTNFTVAPGPSPPTMGPATGTGTVTFTVTGIPRNGTRNFYVGADFGIGDNGSGSSGVANSGFTVSVPGSSRGGTARATAFRPISVAVDSNLAFGAVVRPSSGSGVVQVDAGTNSRIVSGAGAFAFPNPPFARAAYTISGEGGQTISISVPASFLMSGPGPGITVTLNSFGSMPRRLGATMGNDGTYLFYVGGSFPINATTPAGAYSGTFDIIVNYN